MCQKVAGWAGKFGILEGFLLKRGFLCGGVRCAPDTRVHSATNRTGPRVQVRQAGWREVPAARFGGESGGGRASVASASRRPRIVDLYA